MSWREGLNAALLRYVQTKDPAAVEVTEWEDSAYMGGHCDTCSYATVDVTIDYRRGDGTTGHVEFEGGFSSLIRLLDDGPPSP